MLLTWMGDWRPWSRIIHWRQHIWCFRSLRALGVTVFSNFKKSTKKSQCFKSALRYFTSHTPRILSCSTKDLNWIGNLFFLISRIYILRREIIWYVGHYVASLLFLSNFNQISEALANFIRNFQVTSRIPTNLSLAAPCRLTDGRKWRS
jgi:hypothetical protein